MQMSNPPDEYPESEVHVMMP